jgi:hypothetical protein
MILLFKMGEMIRTSNGTKSEKAVLNIGKLIIYLLFFMHFMGCYYWIALKEGQGKRYYREHADHSTDTTHAADTTARHLGTTAAADAHATTTTSSPSPTTAKTTSVSTADSSHSAEHYVADDGSILMDDHGHQVEGDPEMYMKFGPQPTFKEDHWKRFTKHEFPGWENVNHRWEGRAKALFLPIHFVNFGDQEFHKDSHEFGTFFRYIFSVYYAVCAKGNEFGPVNPWEYLFASGMLMATKFANAIVFGQVVSLVSQISQEETNR